jgi:hypothetical protein
MERIDPLIVDVIRVFNEVGFKTKFSCSDHGETNDTTAYIVFVNLSLDKKEKLFKLLHEMSKKILNSQFKMEKGFPEIQVDDSRISVYYKIDRKRMNCKNGKDFDKLNEKFWSWYLQELKKEIKKRSL